ncbi:cytochrome P450 [Actinomadura vinacea]|uniref:Cytochrome P450 n=1 Tax=Actinomadura vinacea TaxID=115336 RepID=A0ABN3K1U0_9ACTN
MSATALTLPFDRPSPLEPPEAYAELRASTPVAQVHIPDGRRAWLVTSYEAVVAVLTDPRFRLAPPGLESSGNDTLFQDGDAHTRLRRLVSKAFTPRAITALRPHIERLATEQVAAFAAAGPPADVVAGLAAPLSTQVIGDLLGVAIDERERFHALVEAVSSAEFFTADAEAAAAMAQAWNDLTGYAAGLVATKRGDLGDDLLSALINVRDAQDGRLSDDELIGMATTLVAAGHQTTRNAISAGTIQLVAENRLADAPERLDEVVEELLRDLAGVIAEPFPRWAHEDMELEGASIKPGDLVLVRLEAANHDPRHSGKAHVSFGRGPHHCLGASLARIELAAAIRALALRLPGLRLQVPVEDLVWVRGETDAGPKAVPVTW